MTGTFHKKQSPVTFLKDGIILTLKVSGSQPVSYELQKVNINIDINF